MSETPTEISALTEDQLAESKILVVDDNVQNLELLVANLDAEHLGRLCRRNGCGKKEKKPTTPSSQSNSPFSLSLSLSLISSSTRFFSSFSRSGLILGDASGPVIFSGITASVNSSSSSGVAF